MTATTSPRLNNVFFWTFPEYPILYDMEASTKVLHGTVVALNASGNVVPVTTVSSPPASIKVLGIATETVDNRGVAGALKVEVKWGLVSLENGESITKADIGRLAFIGDNQTAFRTSANNTRPLAGTIRGLRADGRVWVQLSPGLVPALNDNVGRWVDLFPNPNSVMGAASASLTVQTVRDTPFLAQFFRADQDDNLSFSYQLPHNWIVGSPVRPHMHFIPHGSATGVLVVEGRYCWTNVNNGLSMPAWANWTSFRVTKTITPSDQYKELYISLPDVLPPLNVGKSAHLHIFWQRPGASDSGDTYDKTRGADNPTGLDVCNIELVSFDAHVLADGGVGTYYEFGVPE